MFVLITITMQTPDTLPRRNRSSLLDPFTEPSPTQENAIQAKPINQISPTAPLTSSNGYRSTQHYSRNWPLPSTAEYDLYPESRDRNHHPHPLRSNPVRERHVPIMTPYDPYFSQSSAYEYAHTHPRTYTQQNAPLPARREDRLNFTQALQLPPNQEEEHLNLAQALHLDPTPPSTPLICPAVRSMHHVKYNLPPSMEQLAHDHAASENPIVIHHDPAIHNRSRRDQQHQQPQDKELKTKKSVGGLLDRKKVSGLLDKKAGFLDRMGLKSPSSFQELRHIQ